MESVKWKVEVSPAAMNPITFNFQFSTFNLIVSGGLALESAVDGSTTQSTAKASPDASEFKIINYEFKIAVSPTATL